MIDEKLNSVELQDKGAGSAVEKRQRGEILRAADMGSIVADIEKAI